MSVSATSFQFGGHASPSPISVPLNRNDKGMDYRGSLLLGQFQWFYLPT